MDNKNKYQFFDALSDEEYRSLKSSIETHGVLVPVEYDDTGNVLDGYHRVKACDELGITVWPREIRLGLSETEKKNHARIINIARRQLTKDQRIKLWEEMRQDGMTLSAIAAADGTVHLDTVRESLNNSTFGNPKVDTPTKTIGKDGKARPTKYVRHVMLHDNDVKKALSLPEEQQAAVLTGVKTVADAKRDAKREAIIKTLEDIKVIEAKAIQGVYDVIVIDPPWAMKKIERDVRPNQSEFDYPTMIESELHSLSIPCADDCHVWLWTTHKFLPVAFDLLESWKLKYVCTFTWHKAGGFQPIGLPQYNCEFALYARKGTPAFIDTKAFPVCFEAPRGAHSEKPEEFYDMVRRTTAGRRLDMFNRRLIDDFDGWGKEAI